MTAEPLADVLALLEVPQLVGPRHLPVGIDLGHQRRDAIHPLPAPRAKLGVEELGAQRLHGHPAAGDGESLNAFEQQPCAAAGR